MKIGRSIYVVWQVMILALAVVATVLPAPAYCQNDGIILLLQQTPPQGGTIAPETGVHRFEANAEVTLTAVPKPGYQFVYWIGDVSDTTANSTIVYLNSPKIVIAVFERSEYEFLAASEMSRSGRGGGLLHSPADYFNSGGGGGGKRSPKPPGPQEPPEEPPKDFPVPEPIPEPSTIFLLALGSSLGLMRKLKFGNGKKLSKRKL